VSTFSSAEFLPSSVMEDLIKSRVDDPDRALRVAQRRRRRGRLAPGGRLNIVATDHPARRVTKIGDRPLAMADRQDLLARIVRVLMSCLSSTISSSYPVEHRSSTKRCSSAA
jgi:hypothetical protein